MKITVFSVLTCGSLVGNSDVSEESLAYSLYLKFKAARLSEFM